MFNKRLFLWAIFCGILTLSLTACPKKQIVKKAEVVEEKKTEEEKVESEELDIHDKDFVSSETIAAIHFDYDSSELSDEARKVLTLNAEQLKNNENLEILVEGHCDERGTEGYNLALGQKRSMAVRKYYVSLGIQPKRIGSISYGKEKPLCMENTDACWYTNRRAETKVRALKVGKGNSDKKDKAVTKE